MSATRITSTLTAILVASLVAVASASAAATVSVTGGGTVPEGSSGHFTVTSTWIVGTDTPPTFTVATADGTAVKPADYGDPTPSGGGACGGAPGTTCSVDTPYDVPTVNDSLHEANETFSVVVTPTSGILSGSGQADFTIADDDPAPTVSINGVTVNEGAGAATFTISLSAASGLPVDVPWSTAPGTATSPADFTASSGTAHFNPGDTAQTVSVPIVDDNVTEPQEDFSVNLGAPTNATLLAAQGIGHIVDNDPPPVIDVGGSKVTEGNVGTTDAKFELELSHPSAFPIDVSYHTEDGTAHAPDDYQSRSGTVHFDPGQTEKSVHVPVNGDTTDEPDETFSLKLSGPVNATLGDDDAKATIKDDDLPPHVSIVNTSVREGDSGTVQATFDVTLSAASGYPISVDYATADGSASSPSDYASEHGTLTFAPGQTHKQVSIAVNGDTAVEEDETFSVRLSAPVNVTLGDATGQGTIVNDDHAAPATVDSQSRVQSSDGGSSSSPNLGATIRRGHGPHMRLSIADALAGRSLHLVLACPASETVCRGTVTVTGHSRRLGSGRFRIAGGDSRIVKVALSRKARRYLAHGGHAVATILARDTDGNVGLTRRAFRL